MTYEQRFEETCMKCKSAHKCFANAMEHPSNSIRCLNYGTFKKFFLEWKERQCEE